MSTEKEKYIGESLIREEPGKKLKLKIGDKVIKTRHLDDACITPDKLDESVEKLWLTVLNKKADLINGKVPSEQLPSYVDSVINGYYYNGSFYQEATHITEITGEEGKIYVDIPTGESYRWSGFAYILISNPYSVDEEDLTVTNNIIKFKDRPNTDGMGKIILRNNMVSGVNTLTQSMLTQKNTIYVIQYDFTLGEDITVPANCVLEFDGGSLSNGTIVYNSTHISGVVRYANVNVSGSVTNAIIYPEFYGAKGDGTTDDTQALQKALDQGGNISLMPNKTYIVGLVLNYTQSGVISSDFSNLRMYSDTTLNGNGSIIKRANGFLANNDGAMISAAVANNVTIRNLTLDGNGINNLVYYSVNACGWMIRMYAVNNLLIEDCKFINNSGRNDLVLTQKRLFGTTTGIIGNNAIIRNNVFRNGGQYVGSSTLGSINDFSFVYIDYTNVIFEQNEVVNLDLDYDGSVDGLSKDDRYEILATLQNGNFFHSGGYEVHNKKQIVRNNKIMGCYPAIYVCLTNGEDGTDIEITSNNLIDNHIAVKDFQGSRKIVGMNISNNVGRLLAHKSSSSSFLVLSAADMVVEGLVLNGNDIAYSEYSISKAISDENYFSGYREYYAISISRCNVSNALIMGNVFHDILGPAIRFYNPTLKDCIITDNIFATCCMQYSTYKAYQENNFESLKSAILLQIASGHIDGIEIVCNSFFNNYNKYYYNGVLDGALYAIHLLNGINSTNAASLDLHGIHLAKNSYKDVREALHNYNALVLGSKAAIDAFYWLKYEDEISLQSVALNRVPACINVYNRKGDFYGNYSSPTILPTPATFAIQGSGLNYFTSATYKPEYQSVRLAVSSEDSSYPNKYPYISKIVYDSVNLTYRYYTDMVIPNTYSSAIFINGTPIALGFGTTSQRPSYCVFVGEKYFDISLGKPVWWNGSDWVDATSVIAGTPNSGTFANKPTVVTNNIPVGFKYFCTDKQTTEGATDGIEIIHKGDNVWVDALGRVVS